MRVHVTTKIHSILFPITDIYNYDIMLRICTAEPIKEMAAKPQLLGRQPPRPALLFNKSN